MVRSQLLVWNDDSVASGVTFSYGGPDPGYRWLLKDLEVFVDSVGPAQTLWWGVRLVGTALVSWFHVHTGSQFSLTRWQGFLIIPEGFEVVVRNPGAAVITYTVAGSGANLQL